MRVDGRRRKGGGGDCVKVPFRRAKGISPSWACQVPTPSPQPARHRGGAGEEGETHRELASSFTCECPLARVLRVTQRGSRQLSSRRDSRSPAENCSVQEIAPPPSPEEARPVVEVGRRAQGKLPTHLRPLPWARPSKCSTAASTSCNRPRLARLGSSSSSTAVAAAAAASPPPARRRNGGGRAGGRPG